MLSTKKNGRKGWKMGRIRCSSLRMMSATYPEAVTHRGGAIDGFDGNDQLLIGWELTENDVMGTMMMFLK